MAHRSPSLLSFARWEASPEEAVRRAFWIFALAIFAFRVLVLALLPVDLSGDEAYYWAWGRHLDWGYVSKPPGIGWLMALANAVGGDTAFGIRIFAVLLGTGSLICIFHLARRLYGSAVAMISAVVFVTNPANAALNLVLTIDAPLMFFWTLSLFAFWEFIHRSTTRDRLRSGAMLCLGLIGGMWSKQMMLAFLPLALLYLALSKECRPQLRRRSLWFILTVAPLIAWLPPLWWNARNDWVTFHHTAQHFAGGDVSLGRQAIRFLEYIGSQCGIITPVLSGLFTVLLFGALWRWKRLGDRERFLWVFGGPALLVFLALSWRQRIMPNWPAVYYVSAAILLVGWAAEKWSLDSHLDRWRVAFWPGVKVALAFVVAVHLAVFAVSYGVLRLPGLDPTARLRGWSQLAREVDAVRQQLPGGNELLLITQGHRYLASELGFYLADQPQVFRYQPIPEVIESQYDLWETPAAHLGQDALLIVQGDSSTIAAELAARFESVVVHSTLHHPGGRREQRVVTLAIARKLHHWPKRRE